jgi:phosphatidate cytidylyltransferase
MGKRVITALIALGIFLPLLYEGGIGLRTLFLLLSTVGIYEFFQMKKMNIFSVEGVLTLLATLSFLFSQRPLVALPRGIDYFFIYFLIVMLLMTLTVYKSDKVEARRLVDENTEYNVEFIQELDEKHLAYEKQNPEFKLTVFK